MMIHRCPRGHTLEVASRAFHTLVLGSARSGPLCPYCLLDHLRAVIPEMEPVLGQQEENPAGKSARP